MIYVKLRNKVEQLLDHMDKMEVLINNGSKRSFSISTRQSETSTSSNELFPNSIEQPGNAMMNQTAELSKTIRFFLGDIIYDRLSFFRKQGSARSHYARINPIVCEPSIPE